MPAAKVTHEHRSSPWGAVCALTVVVSACAADDGLGTLDKGLLVPPALDFGAAYVGDVVETELLVSATEAGRVWVRALDTPTSVRVGPAAPMAIDGHQTLRLLVRWAPTEAGALHGTLTLWADAAPERFDVAVSGEALPPPPCDDLNPCTADGFDPGQGVCAHTAVADDTPCDDRNACTEHDLCHGGTCLGAAVLCGDGLGCTLDLCDLEQGCIHPVDTSLCDDGDPCTVETCMADGSCDSQALPDGTLCGLTDCAGFRLCLGGACEAFPVAGLPCDDGDDCTEDDTCRQGGCVGVARDCDGDACTEDACDPQVGCLGPSISRVCADGNPCTTDGCDSQVGCIFEPLGGSATCSFASCTLTHACIDGACQPRAASPEEVAACGLDAWYPLGDSELAPRSVEALWGSIGGGGLINSSASASSAAFAFDEAGQLYGAWSESPADQSGPRAKIRHFAAGSWLSLGGELPLCFSHLGRPPLAVAGAGSALVVVAAGQRCAVGPSPELAVFRFAAGAWEDLGSPAATTGGYAVSAVALDANGDIFVAWDTAAGTDSQVFVRRFAGSTWQDVGNASASGVGISNLAGASKPKLALMAPGRPVVSFFRWPAVSTLVVRAFDGAEWIDISSGLGAAGWGSQAHVLRTDSVGRVFVAWQRNASIGVKRYDGGLTGWTDLAAGADGIGITSTYQGSPSFDLVLDVQEQPWVIAPTAQTSLGSGNVAVRRFEAQGWHAVGDGSASGRDLGVSDGQPRHPTLAFDGAGTPWASWLVGIDGALAMTRHTGGAWVPAYGGTAVGDGVGTGADLRLVGFHTDATGAPVLAWMQFDLPGGAALITRRFDGSQWTAYATPLTQADLDGRNFDVAAVVRGRGGDTLAAAYAWGAGTSVLILRWQGGAWQLLGDGPADTMPTITGGFAPSLALDASDRPVVAWDRANPGPVPPTLRVRRFDGVAWHDVGDLDSALGPHIGGSIAVAVDGFDAPIVAASVVDPDTGSYSVRTFRFDGSLWQASGFWPGPSYGSALLAANDGVVLATADARLLKVRQLQGDVWTQLPGPGPEGSVSAATGVVAQWAMSVDPLGHPVVAWTDDSRGNYETYVRRWQGGEWTEWAGSASGGGVSYSGANSRMPALFAADGRVCVAWSEPGGSGPVALVRCADWP